MRSPTYQQELEVVLQEWLTRNGITCAAFAADIGVSRASVSRWVRGTRTPHPELALAIQKATRGHVPVSVWAQTDRLPKAGAALTRWMAERGLSVCAAACLIGTGHTSLGYWMRGRVVPSPASLDALNATTGLGLAAEDFRA